MIKTTVVSGSGRDNNFKGISLPGHWNMASLIKVARKYGFEGSFNVKHCVFDMNHGRSGHDGRWLVTENDNAVKQAAWEEFGREKERTI